MSTDVIVAFLTGGSFIALVNFAKWFLERKDRKSKNNLPKVLSGIHEVYHLIGVILRETSANRVLINRIENGGDIPRIGKDLYESIVYEVNDSALSSIKEAWQRQLIDEAQVRVLMDVAEKGNKLVNTEKLPTCNLKDNYNAGGVAYADKYVIHTEEGLFFYLCIHFRDKPEIDSRYRDLIRYSINELARLIGSQNKS